MLVIVAEALLLAHTPPVTVSVNVVKVPAHKVDGPDIVPPVGTSSTVTVLVATVRPQLLEIA